jgi:type IV secretion system protein VirD4
MRKIELFRDYENAKISRVEDYRATHPGRTCPFDRLEEQNIDGIPLCVTRAPEGHLDVTFASDTHVLAIGATRSGKTTGYVIPTINVLLRKKNKPSLVISDPKQELYRGNAEKFRRAGYRVILLDFTDYRHSDCWNPLTKFYRAYQKYLQVEAEVEVVDTPIGPRNIFREKVYDSQEELDRDIAEARDGYFAEVEMGISALCMAVIPNTNERDPYWDDSARDLLAAILHAMLEDSRDGSITEDNYSFDTVLRIIDSFSDSSTKYDNGYFTNRNIETSKGYQLANKCIIEQANNTRKCISSAFAAKISKFRDTSVRRITCTNTFEMNELDDGQPTVIFVSYKDEESLHYEVISMFLSNLYSELIAVARRKNNRLDRPFYFLLDEFGNLPKFNDFDKVISACGGRNIWFLLVLQSYAQLYHIYGSEIAETIKDNLNTHIFFGTNNPQTKRDFSEECGQKTILSPTSALNGSGEAIERYDKETVALVPVSALNHIAPGECIVTQMGEDVLWSRIERSYTCPEFADDGAVPAQRQLTMRFADEKYRYSVRRPGKEKEDFFDPFDI